MGAALARSPNWLSMKVEEIQDVTILDRSFPGGRPTATGKHMHWDQLFIRVKPAEGHRAHA